MVTIGPSTSVNIQVRNLLADQERIARTIANIADGQFRFVVDIKPREHTIRAPTEHVAASSNRTRGLTVVHVVRRIGSPGLTAPISTSIARIIGQADKNAPKVRSVI